MHDFDSLIPVRYKQVSDVGSCSDASGKVNPGFNLWRNLVHKCKGMFGKAVRIRHCPATVSVLPRVWLTGDEAGNQEERARLSHDATGCVIPGRRFG